MFSPADAIAKLDAALAEAGEDVVLQVTSAGLVTGTPPTIRAFVRGARGEQLAGDVRQRHVKLIMSPTGLASSPKQNDRIVVEGWEPKTVIDVERVRMAGVVVRYVVTAEG